LQPRRLRWAQTDRNGKENLDISGLYERFLMNKP
jgi:hypothetical protein